MSKQVNNVDRAKLGKRNKRLGSDAERYYAKKFREISPQLEHCKTSRQGSKLFDDSKIDLIFIPYNTQIKAGEQRGLKPRDELSSMQTEMEKNFPKTAVEFTFPKILIHKMPAKGSKRTEYDELVTMTFSDFTKIISQIHN